MTALPTFSNRQDQYTFRSPVTQPKGLAMASTLRAHGPPPAIRAPVDSGSHMCDPYGARALVSASHHANTERLRTGLLRSYEIEM